MSTAKTTKSISGFCNADLKSKSHKQCKHVFPFSMGVYEQWTCQCTCHPAGPANVERVGK
jgi:hypothetical protein